MGHEVKWTPDAIRALGTALIEEDGADIKEIRRMVDAIAIGHTSWGMVGFPLAAVHAMVRNYYIQDTESKYRGMQQIDGGLNQVARNQEKADDASGGKKD